VLGRQGGLGLLEINYGRGFLVCAEKTLCLTGFGKAVVIKFNFITGDCRASAVPVSVRSVGAAVVSKDAATPIQNNGAGRLQKILHEKVP
jgi:hypothetical protein